MQPLASRPRVSHVPADADHTFADEAIALVASVGLTLDTWQEDVVRATLGQRPDGSWSVGRAGLSVPRQNGKSAASAAIEVALAMSGYRVISTAHLFGTALNHFQFLRDLFAHPDLAPFVDRVAVSNGKEAIHLTTGGSIRFVARSKASGRGLTAVVLYFDEAQILSAQTYAALLPVISSSPAPLTIFTGTPPAPDEVADSEIFTGIREAGVEGTDERLAWIEYAADEADAVSDPTTWAKANPAFGLRIAEETIADEHATMTGPAFTRERLGMWPRRGASVFDMAAWDGLVDGSKFLDGKRVFFGVDIAPDRSHATVVAAGRLLGGTPALALVESAPGTGWVAPLLREQLLARPTAKVVLDELAVTSLDLRAAGIRGAKTVEVNFADLKAGAAMMLDAVAQGSVRHREQAALTEALRTAKVRTDSTGFRWVRSESSGPLIAASLALWGSLTGSTASEADRWPGLVL